MARVLAKPPPLLGPRTFTVCRHALCRRGAAELAAGLAREAVQRGLEIKVEAALTLCRGECASGPFLGLPELGLYYAGLTPEDAALVAVETAQAGRLIHPRLWLNPTWVMDSRLIWLDHEEVLVGMTGSLCLVGLAAYYFRFNVRESCGKCFPCRLGAPRVERLLRRLMRGGAKEAELAELEETALAMAAAGYCHFAGRITAPLRLALALRREEFARHLEGGCAKGEVHLG
ncbi:MAG: NADH-ubiquinone oxidoreductase-F iron-sulfur binding region domain-containing protein [Thermodesulfobacteriota bacterium]